MNPVSLDASQALWSIQWILQSSRGSEQDCKICVGVRCTMCCIIAHECYMNGMSQAAPHPYSSQFPIHVFQWDFFFPPQGGSHKAEQTLVWSGSETQTNRKDGEKETWGPPPPRASVGEKKKKCRWTRDKARLLCCYGNSYMPISLFVEHCVVIFDKHTHTQLQITSIHQPHPCDTVTIAITSLEK